MKQSTQTITFGILAFLVFIALIAGYIFFGAYTLTMLWQWFVVPLGVKPIGILHAMGLSMFVGYFKGKAVYEEKPEDVPTAEWIAQKLVNFYTKVGVILAVGWVYSLFM